MKITAPARASRARLTLAAGAALALAGAALATQTAAKTAGTPKGPIPDVTVRVEGLHGTLLQPTVVTLTAGSVSKGDAADSCSTLSALGALQDATKGDWEGAWSESYREYFITSILGTAYPQTASYYWAFWLDDKPASSGACSVVPAQGSSILFFPEYDGKSKSVAVPNVLGLSAPASALLGKPFTVLATSYANATGKPSPARGVTLSAGSAHATTTSAGRATLTLTKPGLVEIRGSAPNLVRDEVVICIHKLGAFCPR